MTKLVRDALKFPFATLILNLPEVEKFRNNVAQIVVMNCKSSKLGLFMIAIN